MRSLTGAHFLYSEIKTAWSLNQAVSLFNLPYDYLGFLMLACGKDNREGRLFSQKLSFPSRAFVKYL